MLTFLLIILSLVSNSFQLCNKPRIRHSWYNLSDDDKRLYIEAIQIAKNSGLYDDFVNVHHDEINRKYAHGTSGFLAWHRWFLYIFENKLREIGPRFECVTIPYWPWELEADREGESPLLKPEWFGSPISDKFTHCIKDGPFKNWLSTDDTCIRRTYMPRYGYVGEAQLMSMIISYHSYGNDSQGFRSRFEGSPHAAPHHYLGGSGGHMGQFHSTNDPMFYVHHSNVDRVWALWQDCHDYDQFLGKELPSYAWLHTKKNYDGAKDEMPYHWEPAKGPHPYFTRTVTPTDVYFINNPPIMDYTYQAGDRLKSLLDYTYGECKWDWFKDVEDDPVTKRSIDLDDGKEELARSETAKSMVVNAVRKLGNGHIVKSTSERVHDYISVNTARKSLVEAVRHLNKRNNEEKNHYLDLNTEKSAPKFFDPRVQAAYERIIQEKPYPQVAKHHQLRFTAIEECEINGGKPHSSAEWIIMQDMEDEEASFHSICRYQYLD